MANKATLSLLPNVRLRLQDIVDRGTNWREFERNAIKFLNLIDFIPYHSIMKSENKNPGQP
ncbi:MAG: hypothetical protein PHQ58_13855 [Rhodoferax sp.]|uniref:hypothetical protein n=1 Tax=Rhodoferax sp. TaxID=50421 RepID=UPI00262A9D10|nr:hypothetical protein [Rhodoferax sp.]MDD2881510.1 hypothetical protein [Rhodoferax sp.]